MSESKNNERYKVPPSQMVTPVFMEYPMGLFMGKFMREMKENSKLVGMVCRQCGRTMFPPQALCSICHAENFSDPKWVEVGPKATIAGLMEIKMPWLNPWTLKLRSSEYPVGILMVDAPGSSPGVIWHLIGETDPSKLHVGMRVKAVFKPREERLGQMEDILYWASVEE